MYTELHTYTHATLVYTYVFAPPARMHRDSTYCAGLLGGGLGDVEICTCIESYTYIELYIIYVYEIDTYVKPYT